MTARERDILWEPCADPGLEHLSVRFDPRGLVADGVIIRQRPGTVPFRLWYRIQCDEATRVRSAQAWIESPEERHVDLRADGSGNWTDGTGGSIPGLAGCIDIDIAATPFTNTLPILRLGLAPGQNAEIDVVYLTIPELELRPLRQRYSCLRTEADRSVYLYQNCVSGFAAELPVDTDGLVLDYPGQWRRHTGESRP